MRTSYLPSREGALLTWSNNFKTLINTTPTEYGLTTDQIIAYATQHDAFAAAHQRANDPATRSPLSIQEKNTKRNALIGLTRSLVDIC